MGWVIGDLLWGWSGTRRGSARPRSRRARPRRSSPLSAASTSGPISVWVTRRGSRPAGSRPSAAPSSRIDATVASLSSKSASSSSAISGEWVRSSSSAGRIRAQSGAESVATAWSIHAAQRGLEPGVEVDRRRLRHVGAHHVDQQLVHRAPVPVERRLGHARPFGDGVDGDAPRRRPRRAARSPRRASSSGCGRRAGPSVLGGRRCRLMRDVAAHSIRNDTVSFHYVRPPRRSPVSAHPPAQLVDEHARSPSTSAPSATS